MTKRDKPDDLERRGQTMVEHGRRLAALAAEKSSTTNPNAADLLYGVKAIGEFLGLTLKQAEHRIDRGEIPTFRLGGSKRGTICARRSSLRTWLDYLERQAKAEAANDNDGTGPEAS
jgi:hypothetical protein